MNQRLLLLALYYPPDLSACAFRAGAFVEALRAHHPDLTINVLTSMPNRYRSFSTSAEATEADGAVTIRRVPMPAHRGDMRTQAASYVQFARRAARAAATQQYDLIFATSSRLMTATLGAWISRRSGTPLYLDIRDLFVDTMGDVLSPRVTPVLGPILSGVERWTMRRATKVNLVSPGFEPYFRRRYPSLPLSFFTNGVDEEFILPSTENELGARREPATVVYAGNFGEGQGLHEIVPALAASLGDRVRFRLISDGGRRAQLEQALARAGVGNVELLPPMPRASLIAEYRAADVLFLHLNRHEAFTRVLPSKIFEYAAVGKPIWAGVDGFAATFLRTEVSNAAIFTPCDPDAGVQAWNTLDLRTAPREDFIQTYRRRDLMRQLASDVVAHLPQVDR